MKTYLLFIMLVAIHCTVVTGCSDEPSQKTETVAVPPTFYYYPAANVYYNTADHTYTWFAAEINNWQSGKELPAELNADLTNKVLLQNVAEPIWKDNEQHRMIYAVSFYATPLDLQEEPKEEEKNEPKIIRSKSVNEPKTGIGKFLKKLFSGKDERDKRY